MTRETGFFQAPPPTGSFQGPARSFGFSAGGIVFPELRLRLPSLELPSLYRVRDSARMRVHGSEAPWVSTGFETVRIGGVTAATGEGVPRLGATAASRGATNESRESDSRSRSASGDDCEGARREYERKIDELNRKIKDCDELRKCIEECLKQYPEASVSRLLEGRLPLTDSPEDPALKARTSFPVKRIVPPAPTPDESRRWIEGGLRPASYTTAVERLPAAQILRRLPRVHRSIPQPLPFDTELRPLPPVTE